VKSTSGISEWMESSSILLVANDDDASSSAFLADRGARKIGFLSMADDAANEIRQVERKMPTRFILFTNMENKSWR